MTRTLLPTNSLGIARCNMPSNDGSKIAVIVLIGVKIVVSPCLAKKQINGFEWMLVSEPENRSKAPTCGELHLMAAA